MVMEYC
jgi:5'-AMP-activated protein kinase catalytic alpha subunit